jgi:hypothetical protein
METELTESLMAAIEPIDRSSSALSVPPCFNSISRRASDHRRLGKVDKSHLGA